MAKKPGKHTPYFELVDAQSMAGCPICRLVYKATDRYLDALLYEAVLDPDVRAKLKRSHGFCAEHAEMLKQVSGRALGVAIIYRDTIRNLIALCEQARFVPEKSPLARLLHRPTGGKAAAKSLEPIGSCPACTIGAKAEENVIELFIVHLDDAKLQEAYAQGEGLCLQHLMQTMTHVPDQATLELLVQPQVERYRLMLHDLDEFIRKRDHRFHGEAYGEEGDVWLRAMNAIIGGAGLGLSARSGGRRSSDVIDDRR